MASRVTLAGRSNGRCEFALDCRETALVRFIWVGFLNKLLQVLVGKRVTQLKVDFGFTVLFWSPGYKAEIRIEQPFTFTPHGDSTLRVEPGNVDTVCAALKIFNKDVAAISVENGTLRVEFEGGAWLLVSPHPKYEAWDMAASDGVKIVCTPGGTRDLGHIKTLTVARPRL